jgi:hypothetical protein
MGSSNRRKFPAQPHAWFFHPKQCLPLYRAHKPLYLIVPK